MSGLIFKPKDDGKFYGLTTAYLNINVNKVQMLGRFLQPALEDFATELEQGRRGIGNFKYPGK
jgi:hypothetical protein